MSSTTPPSDSTEPKGERPDLPKEYGIRRDGSGLMAWSYVEARMTRAHNYWVATTRPDGRPHTMPVWGVWLERVFYFGTDRKSRKGRNLLANPAAVVHLESGDELVVVEGTAAEVTDTARIAAIDAAYSAKYGMGLANHPGAPVLFGVSPQRVFAWREKDFPESATRWRLAK